MRYAISSALPRRDGPAVKSEPDWEVEGRDWPNRGASRFVRSGGMLWHVQTLGEGPVLLLIHGTGAATHSWRGLAPLLDRHFRVVALDLPGHGFTTAPPRGAYALPQMAAAVAALLSDMAVQPALVAGHSAGAAIAIRMALDGSLAPRRIVSLNGALMPFPGVAAVAFPALAKLLFLNPFAAPFLAWRGSDPVAVKRLIEGTGSHLDAEGIDLYARLFATRRHVAAAVGMMANWDLVGLKRDLPNLRVPLTLVAADGDRAVPPRDAQAAAAIVPGATVVPVKGHGHLAHEEAPALFADLITQAALA
jgi:magnesium chelatase accessory protein